MKSTEVCVDASLAIKVVVPEIGSDKADALFDRWAGEEIQLIAPVFFEVETDSIFCSMAGKLFSGKLTRPRRFARGSSKKHQG